MAGALTQDRPGRHAHASTIAFVGSGYAAFAFFAYSAATGGIAARLPALGVPIVTYALCHAFIPRIRFSTDQLLGPKNWAMFLFGLQLVLIPLLIIVAGVGRGSLPGLPSDGSINTALLLQALAFASYVAGVVIAERLRAGHISHPKPLRTSTPIPRWLVAGALVMGVVGVYLRFQGLSTVLDYLSGTSPIAYDLTVASRVTTAQSASALFVPFLGAGVALIGCRSIDAWRGKNTRSMAHIVNVTIVLFCLAAAYAVYGYNRGAVVMPLLAMIATISARWRRVPFVVLAALSVGLIVAFLVAGSLRAGYRLTQLGADNSVIASTDFSQTIQIYGQGPQFLGYLLENSPRDGSLLWGESIAASALSPVPGLGHSFRTTSGSAIYNEMIYGTPLVSDQIIPFAGELFLNFYIPGVMLGFVLLGAAIAALERLARTAKSTFGTYAAQYVGLWTGFLVIASVGVLSQVLLYLCAPLLLIVWVSKWGRRSPQATGA